MNGARSAAVELGAALGLEQVREFELADEPMPAGVPPEWDSVAAAAQANRPELRQARLAMQAAGETVRAERALSYPTVSGMVFTGVAPLYVEALQNHWNAAALNVEIPVLGGGFFKARRLEAEARLKQIAESARELANNIAEPPQSSDRPGRSPRFDYQSLRARLDYETGTR